MKNRLLGWLAAALVVATAGFLWADVQVPTAPSPAPATQVYKPVSYVTGGTYQPANQNLLASALTCSNQGGSRFIVEGQLATTGTLKLIATPTVSGVAVVASRTSIVLNSGTSLTGGASFEGLTWLGVPNETYQLQLGTAGVVNRIVVFESIGGNSVAAKRGMSSSGGGGGGGGATLSGITNPSAGELLWSIAGSGNPQLTGPSDAGFTVTGGANRSLNLYADNSNGASIQLSSSGNIDIIAANSNRNIQLTPSGNGVVVVGSSGILGTSATGLDLFATTAKPVTIAADAGNGATVVLAADGHIELSPDGSQDIRPGGAINSSYAINGTQLATGHVYRLPLSYGSATTVTLGAGSARSALDDANIVVTSDQTIDITATGSLGLNTLTSATTFTTAGSATVTAAASVWTDDLTTYRRTLTGTFATTTTTLTGTSSKLLSEISVGDVVRVGAEGAGRITAVASDTSATFVATLPNDGGSTGMTAYVNEGLTFKVGSETARMVNTITDNGLTVVMSGAAVGTAGSQSALWDVEVATQHLFVYAATVSSNGRAFLSTHRSATPNTITGLTAYRRVGYVRNGSGGDFIPFVQHGSGIERTYQILVDSTTEGTRVLANQTAASWSPVVCSAVVPPTARRVTFTLTSQSGVQMFLRPRNIGGSTTTPASVFGSSPVNYLGASLECFTDGAQCVDYIGTSEFIDIGFFVDEL